MTVAAAHNSFTRRRQPHLSLSYRCLYCSHLYWLTIGSKSIYCIYSGGGVVEGLSLPNMNGSGWNLDYKWGVTVRTYTKISGNRPRGSTMDAKTCFVFFCHYTTRTFAHLFCADFERFWNKKTWIGVRMRKALQNFRISAQGILQDPKTTENWYFQGGVCDRCTAQTAQFREMGIIPGTSRHPK